MPSLISVPTSFRPWKFEQISLVASTLADHFPELKQLCRYVEDSILRPLVHEQRDGHEIQLPAAMAEWDQETLKSLLLNRVLDVTNSVETPEGADL